MYNNKLAKAVRLALVFGAGATATVASNAIAFEDDEAKDSSVERIQVTGSRIKRTDMENASPVSVITTETMQLQGIANVADALQQMTAQSGGITAATNNGGSGNATVNLRGLGSARTLVLVNGRRVIASGTGATSTVDLNAIPMAAVQRIEVLKDGASAVYGSDAVAGVVNIIMRKDFEGLEFDAQYAETSEGDGEEATISTTMGIVGEKGNALISFQFYDRGEVRQAARDYSACPIWEATDDNGNPYKYCGGSSFSLGMNAFTPVGRVQFEPGGNGTSSPEGYHAWVNGGDGNDRYNYSALSYLSTPATRYNVSASGNYELTDDMSFFADAYYTNRQSTQQMAPQPIYYAYGANGRNWTMSSDPGIYPFVGLYDFATPGDDQTIYPLRRMQEVGPRVFEQEVNTVNMTIGLEGMFGDYAYETWYTYGRNSAIDRSKNYINMENAIKSVNENCEGVTVTGTWDNYTVEGNDPAAPCINYFGLGSVSESDAAYLRYTDQGTSGTELHHLGFTVSGDLIELPAGMSGFAFGLEHREESAFNQPDAFSSSGIGSGNAVQPTAGGYKVDEAYVELILPLIADLPFAQSVDLEAAMRYFDYDTFGSDSTYKLGLSWRINDSLMLRSVKSTAFRAPSVSELYGGQSDSYTNFTDPCNGVGGADGEAKYATACANDVAAGLIPGDGSWNQGNGQVRAVVGGNPMLGPEEADTLTVGLVAEPIEGLSVTADYYKIELDNVISSLGVGTRFDLCYSAGADGGVGGSNPFCNGVVRNAIGDFDGTPATNENLAFWEVSGWDFNVRYNFEMASLDWTADWEASYVDTWEEIAFAGEDPVDYVGVAMSNSTTVPEWKHNFRVTARGESWSLSYFMMYVDENTTESVALRGTDPSTVADATADSFVSHTLSGNYYLTESITLRAGIDNITDEEPPYYTDYDDSNTDTSLYKYVGRNFFFGANIKF